MYTRLLDYGNGGNSDNVVFALSGSDNGKPFLLVFNSSNEVLTTSI